MWRSYVKAKYISDADRPILLPLAAPARELLLAMAFLEVQPSEYPNGQGAEAAILQDADYVMACLDANRICNLRELLETTEAEHLCLFKGELAKEAGDAAPWLVKLRSGDKLLRMLHTTSLPTRSNPFALREAEAGIFIHTSMDLQALRRHLRRFLRVTTAEDRNFLFRFWEPSIAATYFGGMNDRPEMVLRWFVSREGGRILRIVAPLPDPSAPMIMNIVPRELPTAAPLPRGSFKLSQEDVWRFQQVRLNRDIARLADRLIETFPEAVRKIEGISMSDFARKGVSRMMQFGFTRQSYLFTLLAWDLHYGPRFEHRDPDRILTQILRGSDPQAQRFEKLKARMAQIG